MEDVIRAWKTSQEHNKLNKDPSLLQELSPGITVNAALLSSTRGTSAKCNTSTTTKTWVIYATLTWHACKYKVHKLHQRYILKFSFSLHCSFQEVKWTQVVGCTVFWLCCTNLVTCMFFWGGGVGGGVWSTVFDGCITFWLDSLMTVPDQSSELGGAELGRRLPSPDAGQHALADRHLQPAGPLLHQHSRRSALPGCFPWSISHSPGAAHHQPADPRHVRPSTRHAWFAAGEVGWGVGWGECCPVSGWD